MNTDLTFHRSGTGPAGRRAGRVPSLPFPAIHPPRQPAIPDEGRSQKISPMRWIFLFLFLACFSASGSEVDSAKSSKPRDIFALIDNISIGTKRIDVERLLGPAWQPSPVIAGWNRGQDVHYRNAEYSSFTIHIWYGYIGEQGVGRKSSMNDPMIEKPTIEKQK